MRFFLPCIFILALSLTGSVFAASTAKKAETLDLSESAMTVVIVRDSTEECEPICPQWISADGRITEETPALFKKAFAAMGKAHLPIIMQSPGGEMSAAMEIGRMIRARKLDVSIGWTSLRDGCPSNVDICTIPTFQKDIYHGIAYQMEAYCNSACPLILAAGTKRYVSDQNHVGVHQVLNVWQEGDSVVYRENYKTVHGRRHLVSRTIVRRTKGKTYMTVGLPNDLRRELTAYLNQMGVSTDLFKEMDKAPPSSIYWVSAADLEKIKLTTNHGPNTELESRTICKANQSAPVCVFNASSNPKS